MWLFKRVQANWARKAWFFTLPALRCLIRKRPWGAMTRGWGEISGRRFGPWQPGRTEHPAKPCTPQQTHSQPWDTRANAAKISRATQPISASASLQQTLRPIREWGRGLRLGQPPARRKSEPNWGQQSCQPSSAWISQPQPTCKLFINIKLLIKLDKAQVTRAVHLEQRCFSRPMVLKQLDNHRQKERREGWRGEGRTEGERKKDQNTDISLFAKINSK